MKCSVIQYCGTVWRPVSHAAVTGWAYSSQENEVESTDIDYVDAKSMCFDTLAELARIFQLRLKT